MNTTKLAKVIRKIVREEVQKEVRSILTEQKGQPSKSKKSLTLTEALSQTESEEYRTVQSFNAADARAGFASNGFGTPNVLEGHSGKIVSTEKVDPSVTKALTRDYSELVKRFKK